MKKHNINRSPELQINDLKSGLTRLRRSFRHLKEKTFAEGMVFALIQIVTENPGLANYAKTVFDNAGLSREDFKDTGIESDFEALDLILAEK